MRILSWTYYGVTSAVDRFFFTLVLSDHSLFGYIWSTCAILSEHQGCAQPHSTQPMALSRRHYVAGPQPAIGVSRMCQRVIRCQLLPGRSRHPLFLGDDHARTLVFFVQEKYSSQMPISPLWRGEIDSYALVRVISAPPPLFVRP